MSTVIVNELEQLEAKASEAKAVAKAADAVAAAAVLKLAEATYESNLARFRSRREGPVRDELNRVVGEIFDLELRDVARRGVPDQEVQAVADRHGRSGWRTLTQ